jgi:hypothetical protein
LAIRLTKAPLRKFFWWMLRRIVSRMESYMLSGGGGSHLDNRAANSVDLD